MKIPQAFLFSLTFLFSFALSAQTMIPTSIESVTVYRAGSLVERTAKNTQFFSGRQTLILTGVPNNLVTESIKVDLPSGVRLLKTEYRFMTPDEQGFADFEQIGSKIESAEAEMTAERDLQTSLQEDLAFVGANSDLGAGASIADIKAADAYLASRRREIRASLRASFDRLKELQESTQVLRAEFAVMENELGKTESVIQIELDCPTARKKDIHITYYTPQARWDPFYNVRTDADNRPMSVEFMASIRQNTGENWEEVDLTLSTGNPSIGAREPDLPTWYVSYLDGYVPTNPSRFVPPTIQRTGTFNALVIDQETGKPLTNARIELSYGNEKFIGVSDKNGEVRIPDLMLGSFSLQCQFLGYRDLNTSISLNTTPQLQRIRMSRNGSSQMITAVIQQRQNIIERDIAFGNKDAISGVRSERMYMTSESIDGVIVSEGVPAQYGYDIDEVKLNSSVELRESRVQTTRNFNRVRQSVSTEYVIDQPYSIPSNGASQEVWVSTSEIDASYIHRLRPARSERTHLITRIPDWESLELLKGVAHFFVEGTYNGSAYINPEETSDTLELGLGTDPSITMDRERINTKASKRFFSSKVDETFHYRVSVRNTKSAAVEIEVQEQFPISREDDIEVSEQLAEGASVDEETGIITWKKTLLPGEEYEVEYSFIVTYPRGNRGANLPR